MALIAAALVQGLIEKHGQSYFRRTSGEIDGDKVRATQQLARTLADGL